MTGIPVRQGSLSLAFASRRRQPDEQPSGSA